MDAKDKRIAELDVLLKAALERIAALEAEIAALKKNSSHSSKPPSSDIVKPSKPKDKRKKRKRGAQNGHKQNLRKPFDENQVDKIVPLDLKACPTCGGKLVLSAEPSKVHQQVELVEDLPSRREYTFRRTEVPLSRGPYLYRSKQRGGTSILPALREVNAARHGRAGKFFKNPGSTRRFHNQS